MGNKNFQEKRNSTRRTQEKPSTGKEELFESKKNQSVTYDNARKTIFEWVKQGRNYREIAQISFNIIGWDKPKKFSISEISRIKNHNEVDQTPEKYDLIDEKFGKDIRAIVPQLSMSGGTLIACACKQILMGRQSSLGPIDPQLNGIPATGILDEFKRAHEEISKDKNKIPVWQPIIAKYSPALIGECEKAVQWSLDLTEQYLETGMFDGDEKAEEKIDKILGLLGSHDLTKSHARHIPTTVCKDIGLKILQIEEDPDLQDTILSIHHASSLTITNTPVIKIIENQNGQSFMPTYNPIPPK